LANHNKTNERLVLGGEISTTKSKQKQMCAQKAGFFVQSNCWKTLNLHNITVQKRKLFVPRQNIDVHEQELMKCKYVLLAFSSKTTLRPSKLVFAALKFVRQYLFQHTRQA
jgi:hypothetical protein